MIEGKSPEEIAAALKELPPDHLAKIWAAVDKKDPCPGPVDCSSITVVAKDYKGMLEQPSAPKFKGALAQIYVRSQPYGGSDKSSNGHRYDSMCIVNGMIRASSSASSWRARAPSGARNELGHFLMVMAWICYVVETLSDLKALVRQ